MGRQTFRDESNRKHEPHAEHYIDDKFEKGTDTRNWKKNLDEEVEEDLRVSESDADSLDVSEDQPSVPNAPDRTPVKEPKKKKKPPMGNPQSERKKSPKLRH